MRVYLVLMELTGPWAEGSGPQHEVTHRYLDAVVQGAVSFRGKLIESRIIEREGECQITEEPLDWEGW